MMIRGIGTAGSRNGTIERRESERVREGGGERGIEPNKTSRGKRIAWGAQGQDMTINDKHDKGERERVQQNRQQYALF